MKEYDISSSKKTLRQDLKSERRKISPRDRATVSAAVGAVLARLPDFASATPRRCLLYAALPFEVDVSAIIHQAPQHHYHFPRVLPDSTLEIREVKRSKEDLISGAFGILEPDPERCPLIEICRIELAVIPGLAFSTRGERLGQGGGYYDRLLAAPEWHAHTIGVCYESQFYNKLPVERHDQGVGMVLTEDGVRFDREGQ